mgnify:CR=1 FL=1
MLLLLPDKSSRDPMNDDDASEVKDEFPGIEILLDDSHDAFLSLKVQSVLR